MGLRIARGWTLPCTPVAAAILVVAQAAVPAQDSRHSAARCDGKVVTEITITPRDPSFLAVPARFRALARGVGLVHTTSQADVIGRFLLLSVGQPCSERQRAESERILRLQPFLADATVRVVPDHADGVRIEVETIDEIPTVFGMRFRGLSPSALRFGNGNFGGEGLLLAATIERGFAYRTGFGAQAVAYQAFGRPYTLALEAERAPVGNAVAIALGHAFLTELQRTAWHVGYSDANRYVSFPRPDGDALSLGVGRRFWDLGAVGRVGFRGHSAFVGLLATHEAVRLPTRGVVISDSGLVVDTSAAFGPLASAYHNLRLNGVVGARAISFMPVRGFDALMAVQDVATGIQFGVLIGRGIPRFGSDGDDMFTAADFYAGVGSARSFAALRVGGEARQDRIANRWDSMLGSGRLAWYVKPADAHVLIAGVEFAGARRERVPFQLALGDRQGGVRGYAASNVAGAERGVARVEDRWSIGPAAHAAFGVASFVDAGRVWAGDAPFGVDSRTKVGVGLGLLAAFPPQSQRLWRLDLAAPVSPDAHARWDVRLTGVWTRGFWREPDDVARGRAGAAPSTIFSWP